MYVSIHAPVYVSIHAPVRVRRLIKMSEPDKTGFNSRTREGATADFNCSSSKDEVSIHAPVRVRLYSW